MDHRTTRPQPAVRACRIRRYVAPLAVLAGLAGAPVLAQTGPAQVDRVIDGDTIRVRLDGARDTVRLTGVDTPETTHPTRGVEPDGPEAAADTTARLTGATVRLDRDPAGDDQDADGRILRYVVLATGEHVNATLYRRIIELTRLKLSNIYYPTYIFSAGSTVFAVRPRREFTGQRPVRT